MPHVTGQVFKIYEKEFRGKKLYSIKLEDDPVYYRMNETRNAGIAESGNFIEFEAEPNPDGKSAQVKGPVKAASRPAAQAAVATAVGGGFSAGREASIHYQSARKDALVFVSLLATTGAVKLPAKQALKLKALEALVDAYTAQYLEDIATGGAVARATAAAYSEEAAEDSGDDETDDE
jgi:hypothetical protein